MKRAKKAETTQATYTRDAVPSDKTGSCPCCLREHRASGRAGAMQRHGWKETGRQVGQHGCGFQWGACIGSGMRPLEETDRSAIIVLGRLAEEIEKTRASLARHTAGDDIYRHTTVSDSFGETRTREEASKAADALRAAGYTFTTAEARTGRRLDRLTIQHTVEVTRGAPAIGGAYYDAVTVPAWETLRERAAKVAADMLKALEAQKVAIEKAVAYHFANPSNGGEDKVKRGPAMHLSRTFTRSDGSTLKRAACAAFGFSGARRFMATTEDAAAVTCSKCAKHAAAKAEKAAAK